jgi:O-antigen ligase
MLCLVLGGASAAGFLANGVLQLLGLLFILTVVLSGSLPELSRPARLLIYLFAAAAALLVLELVPLPPFLWQLLPGRGRVAEGYALLGIPAPWLSISLSSDGTLSALASLIPPVAVLLLIYASSGYGRLYTVYGLVAAAIVSILLGLFQRMQGPDSPYYIYEVTNLGGVVGFFANRNHLATLLLTSLPFVAALAVSPKRNAKQDDPKVGRLVITGCIGLFLAVGIVVVKSAAGWMLLTPTLFAGAAIFLRGESGAVPRAVLQIGAALALVCVIGSIAAPIQINDLGDKLSGIDPHMRNQSIRTTAAAALDYLPFGSGGGTFTRIYPHYENPETASLEFLNHAHDDYVEVALEHGIPGLALIVIAFLFWLTQIRRVWRRDQGDALARAGSVAIGLLFAHSLVDYPLRTAAIAAVCALAAALMVAPESAEMPAWQSARRRKRKGKSARTIEISLAN